MVLGRWARACWRVVRGPTARGGSVGRPALYAHSGCRNSPASSGPSGLPCIGLWGCRAVAPPHTASVRSPTMDERPATAARHGRSATAPALDRRGSPESTQVAAQPRAHTPSGNAESGKGGGGRSRSFSHGKRRGLKRAVGAGPCRCVGESTPYSPPPPRAHPLPAATHHALLMPLCRGGPAPPAHPTLRTPARAPALHRHTAADGRTWSTATPRPYSPLVPPCAKNVSGVMRDRAPKGQA